MTHHCGLCGSRETFLWHTDQRTCIRGREFWRCTVCALVFVPPAFRMTPAEEKKIYDTHQNSPDDEGYRRFLSRTFEPVRALLPAAAKGLDFGSGPGPVLSLMFQEAGFSCVNYDIFYAPVAERLQSKYNFITATEVIEHLAEPGETIEKLLSCLQADGLLALMTKRVESKSAFARWHYPMDLTHISFFSDETFTWLATHHNLQLRHSSKDVIVFQCK